MRSPFLLALAPALSACASLTPPDAAQPFFVAPYATVTSSGAVTIRWWPTEASSSAELTLFDGEEAQKIAAQTNQEMSEVTLPISCSNVPLRYQVPGMERAASLSILPCRTAKRVRFVFISDTQSDRKAVRQAALRTAAYHPDFVLHGGDLVEWGSCQSQWIAFFDAVSVYGHHAATAATIGNHELYFDDEIPEFRRFFGEQTWFAFSAGPLDIVVIDSERNNDEAFDAEQLQWLERTLSSFARAPDARRRWRVVLTHHAPYSSSLANAGFVPIGRSGIQRKRYVPLFRQYNVDLVLAGHTHVYERLHVDGVHYVVGGTVGGVMGVVGDREPGSIVLKRNRTISTFVVDEAHLLMKTVNIDGGLVDELRLKRPSSH